MADWCHGSGEWLQPRINFKGTLSVQCEFCERNFSTKSTSTNALSGETVCMVPDHGRVAPAPHEEVTETPQPSALAENPPAGRAAAIWSEFQQVQAWTSTLNGSAAVQTLAARIIVGINSMPALSVLTVIGNAQRARNASTFRQSIEGLLDSSIPANYARNFAGTWEIVMAYYKEVGELQ